ncbi:Protein CBG25752 [Caenorhabditis briggsae]|uniref:Protein CBG25752 n=2 Tax=Caenorhabditis briggsae TaxID=6238 RepID=B6IHS3_CAEBR|nr:Protein CBG25752 [Caenorhabditis briggsae]ULT85162.1 hypothetical protein L3Y34_013709 [Caenorhabditis briggsae]CAR99453.1 Protein CBG25752 [Caenorhabditis briggsae]
MENSKLNQLSNFNCYPPHQTARTAVFDVDSTNAFWGNRRFIEGAQLLEINIDLKERRDGKCFSSTMIYVTDESDAVKRAKLETKDIREVNFMIPEENEKMGIMKMFVSRSGMSEMWRVLPDACRSEAGILESQGIEGHSVPFYFAFKKNGFGCSKFKCTPIQQWSEFGSIFFHLKKWYCSALETAGLLTRGKRIAGPIADPFEMERYHAGLFGCHHYTISVAADVL